MIIIHFNSKIRHCDLALYLYASDDAMTDRLLERGKTSNRVDDNKKTIQNRLNLFHQVTEPVIDYYKANGKLKTVRSICFNDVLLLNTGFDLVFVSILIRSTRNRSLMMFSMRFR
jgi:adenylate kinase family enzyme